MIRDPSDGSSKEITPEANDINRLSSKKALEGITPSGLRAGSARPAEIARLVQSREWLKKHLERKRGGATK